MLLSIDVKDQVTEPIRRIEVLCDLLQGAATSPFDLAPSTTGEAAHIIREEIHKVRAILDL